MSIKKFICGLCKKERRYVGTRKGLRKHLKEEHRIMTELANGSSAVKKGQSTKQKWWMTKDWN